MRLGAQDAEACEAIGQSGAFASVADMLSCEAGPCRCSLLLAYHVDVHVQTTSAADKLQQKGGLDAAMTTV
jgi:hypothetical protein